MPIKLISPTASERDGTSQVGRASGALSPAYVPVDERSAEDILAFTRAYAETLVYYGDDDQPDGDFGAFMGSLSPETVAAFMRDPSAFDPDKDPALFRPHFTLFLAFLRLLEDARAEMNTLTRRHLDFYYRQFLRIEQRAAVPDEVSLLFSLAARERRALVPAGTAVSAGADALGRDQIYRTTRDLVVNRARIAKVSSLFVDRSLLGIQESWHARRNDPEGGRFEMLRIALGRPLPGDPLPKYPGDASSPGGYDLTDDDKTDAKLFALRDLVKFSASGLFLTLAELRSLVGLARIDGDAAAVVANKKAKYRQIIDTIAKKRKPSYVAPSDANLAFGAYASAALGPLAVPGRSDVTTVDAYWSSLLDIEAYFGMSVDDFEILVDKIMVSGPAWSAAYEADAPVVAALLEGAYREKIRADRIADLSAVRSAQSTVAKGYTAVLQRALGDEPTAAAIDADLEDRLRALLTEADLAKLTAAGAAARGGDAARWGDVDSLLVHAMGVRLGSGAPRAEVWRNLFPAAEARSLASTRGAADAAGALPFCAFGRPIPSDLLAPPASLLGFALTSPTLALSGGSRTITLTLGLRASGYDFERLKAVFADTFGKVDASGRSLFPLAVEVSTEKGWVACALPINKPPTFGSYDALIGQASATSWSEHATAPGLQIVLALPDAVAALAPLPATPDGMDSRWPAIRILMQPTFSAASGEYITYYRELGSLFVGAAFLRVEVKGLAPSALENDDMTLDPRRPFEPFGLSPAPGSRLLIGHPEIVTKSIERLAFTFQWMGAPANLADQYANYPIPLPGAPACFVVKVSSLDRSGPLTLAASAPLFASDTAAETTIQTGALSPPIPADFSPLAGAGLASRVSLWKRRFQWELGPVDFQHRTYPAVAAQKSLEFSIDSPKKAAASYHVKPPYTPKLKRITIDYTSSTELVLSRARVGAEARLDRAYHVHPFGVVELFAEGASGAPSFLPRYDKESALYIGLADVSLPETVTLLLQLDEGSADRDVAPPEVTWSQLSGDRWIPLAHKVLSDATRGLQVSGVVELALAAAEPSTLLPSGLTWVRASVTQDHAGICDIRALHAQAARALFDDREGDPAHFNAPLPAGTITKLKTPIPGVAGLSQPYPSHGGRAAEDEARYATRVSERLRHKQRALTSWDYERIVLDAFPQIFKVKCIPAPESAPGLVEVLVIPDVRSVPTNEFGPKAPIALLAAIQAHLAARAPRCAAVRVRSPSYRAVRVRLGVRFAEAGNEAYWMGRLNEELNRFLSPWAYDEGSDIVVGGRIYASSIVEFVDRRPYVDFVAGISLFYTDDEGESFTFLVPPGEGGGAYCVEAGGPDRVLVAYPKHRVDLLTTAQYDTRLYRGVSFMELEMDFVVS